MSVRLFIHKLRRANAATELATLLPALLDRAFILLHPISARHEGDL